MSNNTLADLIDYLAHKEILKSLNLKDALLQVDRKNFVPADLKPFAYKDSPLPLMDNQTISQPTTVVFMLELLDVRAGQNVLDIGAGSGWVSCLLGHLAGKNGKVHAYEINENVGKFGLENVHNSGLSNVDYIIGNAAKEWAKNAPYDRIHSGAAFNRIPRELTNLLKDGGILVAPNQKGYIKKVTKVSENEVVKEKHYGFVFVPFVEK